MSAQNLLIENKQWKLHLENNDRVFALYYQNHLLIKMINFTNQPLNYFKKLQNNQLRSTFLPLPVINKQAKIVNTLNLNNELKINYLTKGQIWFTDGALESKLKISSSQKSITFKYSYKYNKNYYNTYFPLIEFAKIGAIRTINNKNEVKEKVDARNFWTFEDKEKLLIKTEDHRFYLNSSFNSVFKNKQQLIFAPNINLKNRKLFKNWVAHPNSYYPIVFTFEIKNN